jgi:dolichol-phosphate mannosyltransferase
VPYVFRERVEGESKVSSSLYLEYVRHLLRLRLATLPLARFARFAAVGFSGVIVDMGLFYVFSDPHMLGWGLTRSKLLAAQAAILNNFVWNDLWTFGDVAKMQRHPLARVLRFAKFQIICLAGLLLNVILLNLLFNLGHINRYLANALAIGVVTIWNFWLNLKLGWRVTSNPRSPAPARLAESIAVGPESVTDSLE